MVCFLLTWMIHAHEFLSPFGCLGSCGMLVPLKFSAKKPRRRAASPLTLYVLLLTFSALLAGLLARQCL
ncbi:hypothetical protein L210DRAFT_3535532 [Boletus edulis BED1]|uniref:Uncharacterized protein n=1 Tax=Boletus edulis BED1 TaxID=1328754 RepID=A0AAD4BYE8_BOLED|nr:hypothetical protein L210DRAFT_3535532 [Boletus edulis BED1]